MKILVLAVGRRRADPLLEAEGEYLVRLRRHATLEIRDLRDDAALLAAIPARARLIALDEHGEQWASADLARRLIADHEMRGGGAPLVFVVGGADGLPDAVRARAERLLAFGRVTLPHRLARLVLIEQIYRAFSILRGEPYHRE
jgi:23S rRNA (pseudouridine1915-N3)-methyltransferase